MTESTDALNSHNIAGADVHVADRVVNSDTGAQERRRLGRLDTIRDREDRLATEGRVLGVTAVGDDTVDVGLVAGDVVTLVALAAREAVAAVPSGTDELADLPALLGRRDFDDAADNLVACTKKGVRKQGQTSVQEPGPVRCGELREKGLVAYRECAAGRSA